MPITTPEQLQANAETLSKQLMESTTPAQLNALNGQITAITQGLPGAMREADTRTPEARTNLMRSLARLREISSTRMELLRLASTLPAPEQAIAKMTHANLTQLRDALEFHGVHSSELTNLLPTAAQPYGEAVSGRVNMLQSWIRQHPEVTRIAGGVMAFFFLFRPLWNAIRHPIQTTSTIVHNVSGWATGLLGLHWAFPDLFPSVAQQARGLIAPSTTPSTASLGPQILIGENALDLPADREITIGAHRLRILGNPARFVVDGREWRMRLAADGGGAASFIDNLRITRCTRETNGRLNMQIDAGSTTVNTALNQVTSLFNVAPTNLSLNTSYQQVRGDQLNILVAALANPTSNRFTYSTEQGRAIEFVRS